MKKFGKFSKKLLGNKRGQGATEYILLLVVVVAVVLMFKGEITKQINQKLSDLNSGMSQIQPQ